MRVKTSKLRNRRHNRAFKRELIRLIRREANYLNMEWESTPEDLMRQDKLMREFHPEIRALIDMWAYEAKRRQQLLEQFDAMVADMDQLDRTPERVQPVQDGPLADEVES